MFHILGFLFFFILIILVIGLALISKVIRTILGIGRRMTTGNASSSTNTSSRNSQYNSSSSSESNSQRQSNETTSGRKKIFGSDEGEYIESDYIPSSRFNIDDMYKELLQFAGSIKNTYISSLLKAFFVDDADFIRKFNAAGKSVHHGFAGGLLEHSLSVTRMCDKIASNYDFLNRDLLVACGMLHDCGKVRELAEFPKNDYTDEGNFLGHIVMGYEMVTQKMNQIEGFPETLKAEIGHCILAHHRELEYGSPKKPAIAEALALAFADDCDAKMETMREALEAKDTNDWLGYNRWIDANIKRTIV